MRYLSRKAEKGAILGGLVAQGGIADSKRRFHVLQGVRKWLSMAVPLNPLKLYRLDGYNQLLTASAIHSCWLVHTCTTARLSLLEQRNLDDYAGSCPMLTVNSRGAT